MLAPQLCRSFKFSPTMCLTPLLYVITQRFVQHRRLCLWQKPRPLNLHRWAIYPLSPKTTSLTLEPPFPKGSFFILTRETDPRARRRPGGTPRWTSWSWSRQYCALHVKQPLSGRVWLSGWDFNDSAGWGEGRAWSSAVRSAWYAGGFFFIFILAAPCKWVQLPLIIMWCGARLTCEAPPPLPG